MPLQPPLPPMHACSNVLHAAVPLTQRCRLRPLLVGRRRSAMDTGTKTKNAAVAGDSAVATAPQHTVQTRVGLLQKWDSHVAMLTDAQMCSRPVEVRQHLLLFFTKYVVQAGLEGTCGSALNFDECEVIAKYLTPTLAQHTPASADVGILQINVKLATETTWQLAQDLLVSEWKAAVLLHVRKAAAHGTSTLTLQLHLDRNAACPAAGPTLDIYGKWTYSAWCNGEMWHLSYAGKDSIYGGCFTDTHCLTEFRKTCQQWGFKGVNVQFGTRTPVQTNRGNVGYHAFTDKNTKYIRVPLL